MPLKSSTTKNTATQDLHELKRQIIDLAANQTQLFKTQRELSNLIKKNNEEMKNNIDVVLNAIRELKDEINLITIGSSTERSNSSISSLVYPATLTRQGSMASSYASTCTEREDFVLNVIPAPRKHKISKGKRTSVRIRSIKEHIIDLVIKRGNYQNIDDDKADAIYNTMKTERKVALDNLARDALIRKQTQDPFFDITTNITWTSIHDTDRKVAIEAFTEAVWKCMPIDLRLCEEHWAAEHMLAEGWNNRDNHFKEAFEQLEIEEVATAGATEGVRTTTTSSSSTVAV
ncbi:hypothetical protein INT45_014172 [Circinella minor]|uniref:Uncharacterized protein n=1 Tax=Circinella minor TaxID=1195481 RepID=A0A8H7RKA8_9FUNG|nr:hypothetical protein INT45_014172 [Circinella minor]